MKKTLSLLLCATLLVNNALQCFPVNETDSEDSFSHRGHFSSIDEDDDHSKKRSENDPDMPDLVDDDEITLSPLHSNFFHQSNEGEDSEGNEESADSADSNTSTRPFQRQSHPLNTSNPPASQNFFDEEPYSQTVPISGLPLHAWVLNFGGEGNSQEYAQLESGDDYPENPDDRPHNVRLRWPVFLRMGPPSFNADNNSPQNPQGVTIRRPTPWLSIIRLVCGDYSQESPNKVKLVFTLSVAEVMGGLLLMHIPHMAQFAHEGNEPTVKRSLGQWIYGEKWREQYRTFNMVTGHRALGYFLLFDGIKRTLATGHEMLDIFLNVEHRGPALHTSSNRVSRHANLFLRGVLTLTIGWAIPQVQQSLMIICPHLEDEREAPEVRGSYLVTSLVSTGLWVQGLITTTIGAIQLVGDGLKWLCGSRD